jgi:DNA mismatch repair protein MutS
LRRIVPGGADKSYGVHVARLAGIPGSVVNRAWEYLSYLEDSSDKGTRSKGEPFQQLPLMQMAPAVIEDLLGMDMSSITPLEAINRLYELQEKARADSQN